MTNDSTTESTEWIVRWENGKSKRFVPYDYLGVTQFVINGLKEGKVYLNEKEVVEHIMWDGSSYRKLRIGGDDSVPM
jgi:hypothetical protein